jgi:DNA-binding NarL/FixJ family response regulator
LKKKIDVLIVDDHPIFRRGLRSILEHEDTINIVGDVSDGEMALEFLKHQAVDIALLDLDMPRMNGFEFAQAISRQNIQIELIILTMHKEEDIFTRAMDLGVRGFISKENAATEIAEGIRTVMKGKFYVCSMFSHFLVHRSGQQGINPKQSTGMDLLTPAEHRVLKLIAENKSSKQIGNELMISYKTVENHRTNICSKLNIHGSHALLRFLLENKSLL